jgi:hypothetical protein
MLEGGRVFTSDLIRATCCVREERTTAQNDNGGGLQALSVDCQADEFLSLAGNQPGCL